jgi:hypothetical protein
VSEDTKFWLTVVVFGVVYVWIFIGAWTYLLGRGSK